MLSTFFSNKFQSFSKNTINDVSLSDDEINQLQEKAKTHRLTYSESNKTSLESMAGDLQSRTRGSGIDFEENKPYQSGSDSRHINWRTYARTQQLYTNIYNEDKRPSFYLVLDQRRDMYFGTRKQLKIKQALNIAIFSIFKAMQQQHTVAGIQILKKPQWHASYTGQSSALSFIKILNTPALFKENNLSEPALNDILDKIQLRDGAELMIISDFHDMNDKTITALYNISRNHKTNLTQVLDPIEIKLPNQGHFNIKENSLSPPLKINCNNKKLINQYKNRLKEQFEMHQTQCQNMGVVFNRYLTTDNIFQL